MRKHIEPVGIPSVYGGEDVNMAQLAEWLPNMAPGYIYNPVSEATQLEGGWDFTLSLSPAGQLMNGGGRGAPAGGDAAPPASGVPTASDPNGAVSLIDAVNRQLGLKLEMHKRSLPVLVIVIDHIEEKPTENGVSSRRSSRM
jgi:uncharacterized protein (TIGR03435 family)